MDLAQRDYIYIRDGSDASAPLLAQYSGTTGPSLVFSTQRYMYILLKTGMNVDVTNKGFQFTYKTGKLLIHQIKKNKCYK